MSPDVLTSNGQSFHVERAFVGFKGLYVAGNRDTVNAVTEAEEHIIGVTSTREEEKTPEVLKKDTENITSVIFSEDDLPLTVHELSKEVA